MRKGGRPCAVLEPRTETVTGIRCPLRALGPRASHSPGAKELWDRVPGARLPESEAASPSSVVGFRLMHIAHGPAPSLKGFPCPPLAQWIAPQLPGLGARRLRVQDSWASVRATIGTREATAHPLARPLRDCGNEKMKAGAGHLTRTSRSRGNP